MKTIKEADIDRNAMKLIQATLATVVDSPDPSSRETMIKGLAQIAGVILLAKHLREELTLP